MCKKTDASLNKFRFFLQNNLPDSSNLSRIHFLSMKSRSLNVTAVLVNNDTSILYILNGT